MAWDRAVKATLQSATTIAIDAAIRVRVNASGGGVGADYLAATDPRVAPDTMLDLETLEIAAVGVSVPDFRYQAGGFSVEVAIPASIWAGKRGGFFRSFRRGSLIELLIGFGSGDLSDYLRYRLGVISNVLILNRNRARIEVYDILYGLKSRPFPEELAGEPQSQLFYGLAGTSTTLNANYTAGNTAITLSSVDNFETFDGTGVANIEGNSGSVFYVQFTGVDAGLKQLTGVSGGYFGTSDENASSGNEALSCAFINTHPITAIHRLLSSTGTTGANGAQDIYPLAAGFAIDQDWLDLDGFRDWTTNVVKVSSGTYRISVVIEEPIEDGLLWVQSMLAELGIWLVSVEGQISVRAAQTLTSTNIEHPIPIGDALIGPNEFPILACYDPASPYAYNRVTVQTEDSSANTGATVTVLPVRDELVYDASGTIRENESVIRTEILSRIDDYGHHIPERLSLPIQGAFWGFAPGDVVRVSSDRIRSRFKSAHDGYESRAMFVAGLNENPITGASSLELLAYPLNTDDDYG